MDVLKGVLEYLLNHSIEVISLFIAYLSLFVPIRQYLGQKKLEERDKRFQNYHRLLDELLGGKSEKVMIDRQIAIIFEFRNYPEYFEVTERILLGLLDSWRESPSAARAVLEINLTLAFIDAH